MIDISEDVDLAYALSLQAELDQEQENDNGSEDARTVFGPVPVRTPFQDQCQL